MEQNLYQRIMEKTYGEHRDLSQLGKQNIEAIRQAVRDLRLSYQKGVCAKRYDSEENRKAYMLAYYPNYVEPAHQIVSRFVVPALKKHQSFYPTLNLAFFAGGPCPELYGTMKAFQGKQVYGSAMVSILDWESGWQPEQDISWQLCQEDGLLDAHDDGLLIYRCDNLHRCESCSHGHLCRQRIYEKANVYFLQNFLSHVKPEEEDCFLEKMHTCIERAQQGSVFVIMDLPYANSLRLMLDLDEQEGLPWSANVKTLGTNIYNDGQPEWSQCPYEMPLSLRETVFTGEDGLIPKKWTKYYYLVLQKC